MLNWEFIERSLPLYQDALFITLKLAFWGIIGATILGLLIAIIKIKKIPI